ncbi:MAG: chemotaxis protein CheA [Firmicutes bacterium]|nr:chemotaxis protein CheA [Bacillota bacterium]
MDTSQYLGIFVDEAKEHIQNMNEGLLALEQDPEDESTIEVIFRAAHTLKGMSATMGFDSIAELTHAMENVFDKIRHAEIKVTPETMDTLFKCLDSLEEFLAKVANGEEDYPDVEGLISDLQARLEGRAEAAAIAEEDLAVPGAEEADDKARAEEAALLEPILLGADTLREMQEEVQKGLIPLQIKVTLDENCVLKSARAYLVIRNLEERGQIVKVVPPVEELEEEKFDLSFELVYLSYLNKPEVRSVIENISEIAAVDIIEYPLADKAKAGAEADKPEGSEPSQVETDEYKKETPHQDKGRDHKSSPLHKSKVRQTVRVDIEKLDGLMNLVAELVINRSRLAQIGVDNNQAIFNETIGELAQITTDLQSLVMKARMVPIDQVFNRFPRMVRDLSRELGKEINLVIEGAETELDRSVVDEIGDPLVHLLRNAADHGIEPPEERERLGKPRSGTIKLSARHEGNQVVVEISDDGAGIDYDKIRRKAVQKGFITEDEANNLTNEEAAKLLFKSGFSTAEKVTDVSGRGVGLDVVASKIQALNGTVDLESELGKGSTFTIKLPLTLAIIQALLVKLGKNEVYALPLENIEEIINITKDELKSVQGQKYILYRGQVIPAIDLSELFEVPDAVEHDQAKRTMVVIKAAGRRLGLMVDDLIGQQEIVIKSLDNLIKDVEGFAGAAILGDGTVSLILDVLEIAAIQKRLAKETGEVQEAACTRE